VTSKRHRERAGTCRVFVITGTDTGVGKTVLTCRLVRELRAAGRQVVALKPVSSGDRGDARALRAALGGGVALDAINPWHFRAALAPRLAAQREGSRVTLREVARFVRSAAKQADIVLIEGAGGLLSPLGEDFDTRDLIRALQATPIVVCPNRLGAVNQTLLVLEALPRSAARRAHVVLVPQGRPDVAARSNAALLLELRPGLRVHVLRRGAHVAREMLPR
jgi:dethiobiotin synthetase